jgi:hypothetical protein
MPFRAASFDAVVSAFGFVFAADHTQAGAELGRVCKAGARLALTSWTYDEFSLVGERLGREYPAGEDARQWSDEAHARERLSLFDLRFQRGEWVLRAESADELWNLIRTGVPPLKLWLEALPEQAREEARRAYSAVFPDGVLRRDYVLITGSRR